MVLYKNENEKVICLLARIESMSEGKGKAEGRKMSVAISYHSYKDGKDNVMTDRLDFWNASDEKKPQLADRIRKESIGQYIVVMVSYKESDHTALAYMSKSGTFTFNKGTEYEKNIILGKPSAIQKFMEGNKKALRIGIPVTTGKGKFWHVITYLEEAAEKAFACANKAKDNNNLLVVVAGKKNKWKTKKNEDAFSYSGLKAYEIRKVDKRTVPSEQTKDENQEHPQEAFMIINIGPYENRPIKSCNILNVPEEKKRRTLVWMQYIAEEWEPDEGPWKESQLKQKAEIAKIFSENKAC